MSRIPLDAGLALRRCVAPFLAGFDISQSSAQRADEHSDMTGSRSAAAQGSPEELVRRAAGGDTAAFARIVRLHNQGMTRVAYAITADPIVAVAATEAAWFSAWGGLRRKRTPEALGSWLCSLAATEAVDIARRTAEPGAATPEPGGRSPGVPSGDELARALARLDPEDRALLVLRHVAGLSVAELSEAVRRSRPPVAHRLAWLNDDIGRHLSPGSDAADIDRLVGAASPLRGCPR